MMEINNLLQKKLKNLEDDTLECLKKERPEMVQWWYI